ncbi:hypothetical protein [Microbacterium sp.]|uniref:hypothetical protein n=1 Tax=Microbacterium sp. TaxID=51671 RepID=UPI003F71FFAC
MTDTIPLRSRIRNRLDTHGGALLSWAIIATSFVIGYLRVLRTQPIYTPDSAFYLAKALWFSGMSREDARNAVIEFGAAYTSKGVAPLEQLFDWGLVQPRVVLSALAAPFVAIWGPIGLAVTTALLTVGLTIAASLLLMRRYGNLPAVAVMLLVHTSTYIMWFDAAMLTESLSALLSVGMLAAGWAYIRRRRTWLLVALFTLVALAAFTRQATLIPAGAFVMAWLLGMLVNRSWRSEWMWPAVVLGGGSVGLQLLQMLVFAPFSQTDQFLSQTGSDSLGGAILAIPGVARRILSEDVRAFLANDPSVLVLIVLALAGIVLFWKRSESHLLVGALLGLALYNITNGTATAFRYALPGLVFYLVSAALVLRRTGDVVRPRDAPADPPAADAVPAAR